MNHSKMSESTDPKKEPRTNPCPMCKQGVVGKNSKTGLCGTCSRSYDSVLKNDLKMAEGESARSKSESKLDAVTRCHFASMRVLNMDIPAEEKVEILKLIYGLPQ